MSDSHPGLNLSKTFLNKSKSDPTKEIFTQGYTIISKLISQKECQKLTDDLDLIRGKWPYHIEGNDSYAGVFRSPFIFFNSYRDLLLNKIISDYLDEIFPCNYQLHLSRCVENKPTEIAATAEWHRDIPYLHTPSTYPISISALTFLSDISEIQIEILKNSNASSFYDLNLQETIMMNPKVGDVLLFDSNLVHRTLPTSKRVVYNLYMYSSPVIKPVVSYSSKSIKELISENNYRIEDLNKVIGYEYLIPPDDEIYMSKKLIDK